MDARVRDHEPTASLDRAALVVSIDVEMSWGLIHRPERSYDFPDEREQMHRLLDLFDTHQVPATWAFVGHLLLDGCEREGGLAHPELVRPGYDWFEGDWLGADPCATADDAPTWYAPDLFDDIRRRAVQHEIGSHAFSHLIAGDPGCSEEAFRSDLRHCRSAAERRESPLTSFIYPRNQYGHERVLGQEGFTNFRGPRDDPFRGGAPLSRRVRRLGDLVAPGSASTVRPVAQHGVWNLPATYLHDVGDPRRYPLRLLQARRRMNQAVRHRGLFHVWFHPHNVRHETDRWFDGLDRLLEQAVRLRSAGRLDTLTMGEVASRLGPAVESSAATRP